jgi:hypothetical protein
LGAFHVENDNGEENDGISNEKNTMIVWRACGLERFFTNKSKIRFLDEQVEKPELLSWERIVPKVNTAFPLRPDAESQHNEDQNNRAAAATTAAAPKDDLTALVQKLEPIMLSRGEAQGGHYSSIQGTPSNDCFIIYGGMHRHTTAVLENGANDPSINNEVPLGDVWKYDYETQTLSLLAPYPPLDWQVRIKYFSLWNVGKLKFY